MIPWVAEVAVAAGLAWWVAAAAGLAWWLGFGGVGAPAGMAPGGAVFSDRCLRAVRCFGRVIDGFRSPTLVGGGVGVGGASREGGSRGVDPDGCAASGPVWKTERRLSVV